MAASKLTIRISALLIYCVISAGLMCRFLLQSVEIQPAPQPPAIEPDSALRKLFRFPETADSGKADSGGGGIGAEAAAAESATAADEAKAAILERAGFRLPQLPLDVSNATARALALEFFDLRRRHRLAATRPESAEAATVRQNADLLSFRFGLTVRPCTAGERILVTVMTTSSAVDRREAARRTWTTEAAAAGARVVFIVAGSDGNSTSLRRLEAESASHGDIVLVTSFTDTYRHLTLKVLAAADFACRLCPTARMLAKVDDDSVLNLPALRRNWLDRYERQFPHLEYVLGYRYETPAVKRQGRWKVARSDYPLDRFPSYMFGGAYVLRLDTCRMVAAARYFQLPPVEDAFITGVLPAALGIRQAADNSGFACQFFNHAYTLNAAAYRSGMVMSGTDLTPGYMMNFWQRYLRLTESESPGRLL